MNDVERKNEIDIVEIKGEIKLLAQKIEVIKNDAENDICLLNFERNNEYRGIKLIINPS